MTEIQLNNIHPTMVRCTDEDYGNKTTYEIRNGEKVIASIDEKGNYDVLQVVQRIINIHDELVATLVEKGIHIAYCDGTGKTCAVCRVVLKVHAEVEGGK